MLSFSTAVLNQELLHVLISVNVLLMNIISGNLPSNLSIYVRFCVDDSPKQKVQKFINIISEISNGIFDVVTFSLPDNEFKCLLNKGAQGNISLRQEILNNCI